MHYLLTNPLLQAYQGSDFFGKLIFISLIALSIVTWALFFKKFTAQRFIKQRGGQFITLFQKRQKNPLGLEIGEAHHPFAVLYKTLKLRSFELLQKNQQAALSSSDVALIEAHVMTTLSEESKELEKNLFVLSTIVSLAPFLGLLGTVWGILLTFGELQAGGGGDSNAAIMGGLSMALGTTVLGLLVAIPALIGYNYLKAGCLRLSADMEDFSRILLTSIELYYRQVELS